jgi:hypothetical protein
MVFVVMIEELVWIYEFLVLLSEDEWWTMRWLLSGQRSENDAGLAC